MTEIWRCQFKHEEFTSNPRKHRVRRRVPSALGPGHGGGGEIGHAATENGHWPGAGFSCELGSRGEPMGEAQGKGPGGAGGREIQGCPGREYKHPPGLETTPFSGW